MKVNGTWWYVKEIEQKKWLKFINMELGKNPDLLWLNMVKRKKFERIKFEKN